MRGRFRYDRAMQRSMRGQTWAALAAALCACGPEKNEETEGATSSSSTDATATTASATTVQEPTTAPTTGVTGTGGDSESTGSTGGSGGLCREAPAEIEQTCTSQTDRVGCNAAELDATMGRCLWIPWFPTRVMDGMCSFGDPRGQCAFVRCQEEGCAQLSPCGPEGFGGAFITGQDGVVSVGFADWCLGPPAPAQPCLFDFEGELIEGPPECACLCSADFPGN